MAITLQEVLQFIRNPNLDPNDRTLIVGALNAQVKAKRAEAKCGLYPGKKVTFFSTRSYRQVTGRITKVNKVNVDLTEDGTGTKWRVSPGLVKSVDTAVEGDEF